MANFMKDRLSSICARSLMEGGEPTPLESAAKRMAHDAMEALTGPPQDTRHRLRGVASIPPFAPPSPVMPYFRAISCAGPD